MVKEGGNRPALKFINKTISRRKNYILILLVVQAFLGISGVFYALCIRSVIDEAVAGKKNEFCRYILYFICIVIFQIILRAVLRFMEEYARSTYENIFKLQLFKTILTKDFSQVTKFHSGEWMNRLTSDSTVVADGIATILPGTVGMTVKIFGALLMIIYIETKFVYIFIPGGLIFLILTYLFRKVLKKLHKQMQEKDGKLRIFLQEYLSSLMLVKTFLVEEKSLSKSIEKMEEHKNARMKKNHFSNLCNIGFAIMMQGTYVIGLAYCGYGILNNTISYGTLMAVMQLISQIQSPFANITGYLPKYYAMIASAERLMLAEEFNSDEFSAEGFNEGKFSIEDLKKKRAKKIKYNDEFNVILMKNISFFYDNNNKVLTDFSLEINKGEFVAIT